MKLVQKYSNKWAASSEFWYLSPMRAAKVQASLRIRAVSPEPPLLAHTSSEPRGTFRQKARSLAPLKGWACAVKICHDGMLKDTNLLDAPQIKCQNYKTLKFLKRVGGKNHSNAEKDIGKGFQEAFGYSDSASNAPIICNGFSLTHKECM